MRTGLFPLAAFVSQAQSGRVIKRIKDEVWTAEVTGRPRACTIRRISRLGPDGQVATGSRMRAMLSSLAALRCPKLTGHWFSFPPEQVYHLFRLASGHRP